MLLGLMVKCSERLVTIVCQWSIWCYFMAFIHNSQPECNRTWAGLFIGLGKAQKVTRGTHKWITNGRRVKHNLSIKLNEILYMDPEKCGIEKYFFMPKAVQDRYSTVQIRSSLSSRLCPKRFVLGIQKSENMGFRLQSVCSWVWGQDEATARAPIIHRHSLWVKRVLWISFVSFNSVWNEDRKCSVLFFFLHWRF